MIGKILCRIGFHQLTAYWDIEYSKNGAAYFCKRCHKQFDGNKQQLPTLTLEQIAERNRACEHDIQHGECIYCGLIIEEEE